MKRKDIMKLIVKKHICVLMAALLVLLPFSTSVHAAEQTAFKYPDGVPAAKAEEIITSADALVLKAVQTMTDKTLAQAVMPMLYESNLLSTMLIGIYKTLNSPDMAEMLSALSVTTSPTELSAVLFAYPEVSAALANTSSWDTADLSDVSWNIHTKNEFATAFGTILSPLHTLLQFLLCEGKFNIVGNLIKYTGGNGYMNAVVPVYEAFGCTSYPDYSTFQSQAAANGQTLGANLILPILQYVEEILTSPLTNLCSVLPNLADFILSGGFEDAINALLAPITELAATIEKIPLLNSVISDSMFSGLSDNFAGNLVPDLNEMLNNSETGLALPEIDWELLRSCGTSDGTKVVANKGKTFVVVFRWLWETLQQNGNALGDLLSQGAETESSNEMFGSMDLSSVLNEFLQDDADSVLRALAFMLKPDTKASDLYWVYGDIKTTAYAFTQDMPRENYAKMMEGFDSLLGALIAEMTSSASLSEGVKSMLYTNDNITAVIKTIYGLLNDESMAPVVSLLGIEATPKAVFAQLEDEQYKAAVTFLSRYLTWEEVPDSGINWGFTDGDKAAFAAACAAVLRPVNDLLAFLLAGEDFVFLDSITIRGAYGYNSAVIPLFEALGVDASLYVSAAEYNKTADTDALLTNILNPLFTQIENICQSPVTYLTAQLPTIAYFISDGGLQKMLYALAAPILEFIARSGLSVDIMSVMEEMIAFDLTFGPEQMKKLMAEMNTGENSMALPELPALSTLASLGTLKEIDSKRTFDGKATKSKVVEADKESVLAYLVDFIVSMMQMPENADMLTGSIMSADSADAANPFASYTDSFSAEMENMTHADMVRWFYDMVVFEAPAEEESVTLPDEVPQIIYQSEEDGTNIGAVIIPVLIAAAAVVFIVLIVKKRKQGGNRKHKETEE